ncbi:MAG: hypothetical protein M1830_002767 [Pleopsidium flavum]|nr:MAG: hypothetical protein M1830_002767 [Pleopsidium flavum]
MSWTWCQGQNVSCDTNSNGNRDHDPDIAGPGVLAAFITTALATVVAIYIGYLTDSLNDASLNRIDTMAVAWLRRHLGFKPLLQHDDPLTRKAKRIRSEALIRFVLTLSDQQLVTGLAVLIAAFAKHCTITGGDFLIATALAWFSSMTHLATLSLLRFHFLERPLVRLLRLFGMMSVLGMLLAAEVISELAMFNHPYLPVHCALTVKDSSPSSGFPGEKVLIWLLLYLIIGYGNRITSLYNEDSALTVFGWLLRKAQRKAGVLEGMTYQERARRALDNIHGVRRRKIWQNFTDYVSISGFFFDQLLNSFLWQLMFATFGFIYGLLEVCVNRWVDFYYTDNVGAGADAMGFGQIMPLLLLLLPILAALEVYEDMHGSLEAEAAHVFGRDNMAEPVTISASTSAGTQCGGEQRLEPLSIPATRIGPITKPETLPLESLTHGSCAVVGGRTNASQNPVANAAIPSRASLAEPRRDFTLSLTERETTASNQLTDFALRSALKRRDTENTIGIEAESADTTGGGALADPLSADQLDGLYRYKNAHRIAAGWETTHTSQNRPSILPSYLDQPAPLLFAEQQLAVKLQMVLFIANLSNGYRIDKIPEHKQREGNYLGEMMPFELITRCHGTLLSWK